MEGWNTSFLFGRPIFRGELSVSGRVGKTSGYNQPSPSEISQVIRERGPFGLVRTWLANHGSSWRIIPGLVAVVNSHG